MKRRPMELNPNHKATIAAHDHWHKICALMMFKMGVREFVISPQEIIKAFDTQLNIAVQFDDEIGVRLFLVDEDQAMDLARREGGLPV